MAAKLLHSLADDNPDLQKQIGCMTGIFQVFDRQHFISGRRPNQRRLLPPPSGTSKLSNENLEADSSNAYTRESVEKNPRKDSNEKQRASTESSRASFSSSSRSSSFSSLDCARIGQPEPSSMDRMIFPEIPSRDPVISQTTASQKMGRLSVDLRDMVKDAMHRDSRGLSMQTTNRVETSSHSIKHKDSPRPLQLPISMDESLGVGSNGNTVPADIRESLRVLSKLRDAQWNLNEKELPRLSYESNEGSSFPMSRDAPRFSFDGREISNRKIKDSPRLSLGSKESSARSTINDSNFLQPSFSQSRPSSVVAKLMGLDMLSETKIPSESQLGPVRTSTEGNDMSLAPLRFPDVYKLVRLPKSPRSSRKEPTLPPRRTADAVMKPVSSSKFPIEPAPWKHQDSGRASPKQASKQVKSSANILSNSQSVYGEIEKRLKDIEFKQSGKDLRALKHILESIQAKGILEATNVEQSLTFGDKQDNDQRVGSYVNFKMMDSYDSRPNRPIASKHRGNATSKAYESPIVIMKPAKLVQKSGIPGSSVIPIDSLPGLHRPHSSEGLAYRKNSTSSRIPKDQTTRDSHRDQTATSADKKPNNRNSRVAQSASKSPQPQVGRDNTTNTLKSSGSVSPRLQQRKLEFDRRSRPPTPPSDSSKTRKQSHRQSTESVSPGGRHRISKISNVRQVDDQSSEKSNYFKNSSFREDTASMHSDTNLALETRIGTEDASSEQFVEMASCQSPSRVPFNPRMLEEIKEDVRLMLNEKDVVKDLAIGPEQPSPVSVLDSSVYMEGSPSPVKQTSHSLEGHAITEFTGSPGEELWGSEANPSANCTILELPSEISRKKLQSIDNLVQKLRRLNSSHDESQTDYIASLCENTNPDHRYISEILLASGLLLRELSSSLTAFQLHPSGHPINPELFFVLEQTKASSVLAKGENNGDEIALLKSKPQKFHRKLIFDTVNELLVGKLALVGHSPEPWFKPEKLARKNLNAQKLLRELCAEIELLQVKKQEFSLEEEEDGLKSILCEDVLHRSESWTDFRGEVSSIVLDVERSIFKDLVDEVIRGEAGGIQGKSSRWCRQLFSK